MPPPQVCGDRYVQESKIYIFLIEQWPVWDKTKDQVVHQS